MRILQSGVALAVLMSVAACGSSGGGAAASPSASRTGAGAFAACLRDHGVDVPTARPTARPSGGGFGGAGGQAFAACRSLAPRRFGQGMRQTQAFRACLADHGVHLPTPGARTPGTRPSPGRFGGLSTADPKVAKALTICRPLLPSRSPRPGPS